ncbi:centrosome-associated zinc finger protein CP190 [Pararge aegeria]|uniref:centrosome-associated zinc finger protein CP190 n=1 Tax=Pararge aegeria TaxID=116150 RepID=UPI0019D2B493|nr:centrosome-associated zinc finger protein CP190 [Pararge aegeria]XP_039758393.1 centrosome-associated zinc finger protein CP190 [Pararge aegeria]
MSDTRQVKVDNWGIYFLQRLKHFFNRTDYCDLTLQFQDNAQLKVHRLVLSACTEYFELLERTCEMYEDCLVMPDDLQADVVVPIINFMYTGQLEFKQDLLEKLYQTSLIMNLPILTKLLDAHRPQQKQPPAKPAFSSASYYGKRYSKPGKPVAAPSSSNKRSYHSAFESNELQTDLHKVKKPATDMFSKAECIVKNGTTPSNQFPVFSDKNKRLSKEPRPTRYELPEELDEEHLFDNSFTSLSYGSKPLMIHPETSTKQYGTKRLNLFEEGTSSSRFMRASASDIVECRKIASQENIFLDPGDSMQDDSSFQSTSHNIKGDAKDTSEIFDQILESKSSKITIETKNTAQAHNLDHAKIISEVLKKYPHLVKNNKNIKLKILNTTKAKKSISSNEDKAKSRYDTPNEEKAKTRYEPPDFTYESDVINSKEAAKLIALGADNVAGPWICLICGTPGKALHFTSYFNFRKHLVEIHNEKPIPSMCEYCGVKSQKRNYIVHHKLTKHGVAPPAAYSFPKCNSCDYIALTEALLVKHKTSHASENNHKFHIPSVQMSLAKKTNKKYFSPTERKSNLQCVYCMRQFLREHNLYAHLKINHKDAAKNDGFIEDSEEEQEDEKFSSNIKVTNNESSENLIKVEVPITFENSYEDLNEQYQIEQKPDGSICVSTKKPRILLPSNKNKILNLGFSSPQQNVSSPQKPELLPNASLKRNEFSQNMYQSHMRPISSQETVFIDNNEYILQDNHLIPKKEKSATEYIVSHASNDGEIQSIMPTTSVEYHNINTSNPDRKMLIKSTHVEQPYQIVVSSEEEYKALLNSNQSVLYDEGQEIKALSELGEPENSSLETGTIDLDNTQSNDMMIIPDYHMNVPVTVSADNSNIVVVYSHPVEDPNKQYSLITTQGDFVQSSAIITQNYETVTTCTPVVTTHTLESTWQNNVHATINKLPVTPSVELQTMSTSESITIAPKENVQSNSINELPEVQFRSVTSEPVTIEVAQTETCINNFNEPNIGTITQQRSNPSVGQQSTIATLADSTCLSKMQQVQIESLPSTNHDQMAITTYNQASSLTEEPSTTAHEVASTPNELEPVIVEEVLYQNSDISSAKIVAVNVTTINESCDSVIEGTNCHMNNTPEIPTSTVPNETTEDNEQLPKTISEVQETIENIARDIDETENVLNEQEQCILTDQSKTKVTLTKIAKEQIENLTSEWSEDESEITLAEQRKLPNTNLEVHKRMPTELDEAEESIENIQKEVNKQSVELNAEGNNVPNVSPGLPTKDSENPIADPQKKISSLLHDWDDNDSQEEVTPTDNENEENQQSSNNQDESLRTIDNSGTDDVSDTVDNGDDINKNDNIKRLVSDWDEDDEEENKD